MPAQSIIAVVALPVYGFGGYAVGDCRGDEGTTDRPGTVKNCYAAACSYTSSNGSTTGVVGSQNVSSYITACEVLTADAFASGAVAYKLGAAWGQKLEADESAAADTMPVLNSPNVVYKSLGGLCSAPQTQYANTEIANHVTHDEVNVTYENGICPNCGAYEPTTFKNNKYEISNAGQLYWFAEKVNGKEYKINAVLTQDITVNENLMTELITVNQEDYTATVKKDKTVKNRTPIGGRYSSYQGTFDGNGHTIFGLYYNNSDADFIGLFGSMKGGTVRNLSIEDSYFCCRHYVGAITGASGNIEKCRSVGNVIKGIDHVGGICGQHVTETISDCFNSSVVYCVGKFGYFVSVGGIVGEMFKAIGSSYVRPVVQNCFNTGSIICGTYQNYHIGAIVGYAGSEEIGNDFYLENNYYLSADAPAAAGSATKPANVVNCEAKTAEELMLNCQ